MPNTKILVVEDEVLIAEDLRLILKRLGHQVVGMASSGTEAIRKADELHPNLILMDVRLQGAMDGVETARRIRSKADIAVIYVTAHASTLASLELQNRCARLAKPFSPLQLQTAIAAVMSETQKQAQ
ncbi:MAG: response regulator [Bryobacteraceae bacterium]